MKLLRLRIALAIATSLSILTFVACSSDDNKKGSASPTTAATPAGTPITLDPLPTVEGNVVTSDGKGYKFTYPANWEPSFNIANTPTQKIDVFFAPEAAPTGPTPDPSAQPTIDASQFRATISITCEAIDASRTSQSFFDEKVQVARTFATGDIGTPTNLSIGSVPAFRVQYEQKIQTGGTVQKVDIFAASKKCGYTVSLTSSEAEFATNLATFDAAVATLAFQ